MQPLGRFIDDLPKTLELHRLLAPKIASCVTPIAASFGGKTHQFGTGTLFRAANFSFMVTAAHVLRRGKTQDALFRLIDGESANGPVKYADVALPKWTAYVGEEADVAVVPLSDDAVAALPNRRFLRLDDVAVRATYPGGCWVMGYPAETVAYAESDRKMTYNPFLLAAPLVERNSWLDKFDEDFHFLLNARRDELWWPDSTPAEIPDQLGGISGCPVWQVAWPDGRWQPDHARIVGVQTGYYRKPSLIRATHWGAVAAILHDYCPDLRNILDMHLG
jgi:hypothetical protein